MEQTFERNGNLLFHRCVADAVTGLRLPLLAQQPTRNPWGNNILAARGYTLVAPTSEDNRDRWELDYNTLMDSFAHNCTPNIP